MSAIISIPSALVIVPDVVGNDQDSASESIDDAGLVSAATESYSNTIPAGQVISQDPAPGTEVKIGSTVTIEISMGPEQGQGGSVSGTYPDSPFNGMQIDYSFSGGSAASMEDVHDFSTSRYYTGTLGSGSMTLSGKGSMTWGYYADLSVTIWAGDKQETFETTIDKDSEEQAFELTIPIPADALNGGFSINMTGYYSAGTRGLPSAVVFQFPENKFLSDIFVRGVYCLRSPAGIFFCQGQLYKVAPISEFPDRHQVVMSHTLFISSLNCLKLKSSMRLKSSYVNGSGSPLRISFRRSSTH